MGGNYDGLYLGAVKYIVRAVKPNGKPIPKNKLRRIAEFYEDAVKELAFLDGWVAAQSARDEIDNSTQQPQECNAVKS